MSKLSKVKMFVEPVGLYSRAMVRVANAIKQHAPGHVVFVDRAEDADVQVLHVIDWCDDFWHWPRPHIAIQYCVETTQQMCADRWAEFWHGSVLTWSYYDLARYLNDRGIGAIHDKMFHAPLGADSIFRDNAQQLLRNLITGARPSASRPRDLIVTSGYVSGPGAEAIEEVWNAAERTGWAGVHIGPAAVEGMRRRSMPAGWRSAEGCTDSELADYYRRAYFVSGLRYVEGFEMPAVEGILCGAIPLLFDQWSQRHWFGDLANTMLPESGSKRCLTNRLEEMFSVATHEASRNAVTRDCTLVGTAELATALARFNWASIIPDMFEAAGL